MPHGEIYAALERGLVYGLGFGGVDFSRYGFQKFLKYVPSRSSIATTSASFQSGDVGKLPPDFQKLMRDITIEVERDSATAITQEAAKERATILGAGFRWSSSRIASAISTWPTRRAGTKSRRSRPRTALSCAS